MDRLEITDEQMAASLATARKLRAQAFRDAFVALVSLFKAPAAKVKPQVA